MTSHAGNHLPKRRDPSPPSAKQSSDVLEGFFARSSAKVLAVFLLATPLLVYWAGLAVGTNSNRLSDWLPGNLEETAALEDFNSWFGDGQFVVVSWEGCRLDTTGDPTDASGDDPRLARLARTLVPPVADSASPSDDLATASVVRDQDELVLNAPSNFSSPALAKLNAGDAELSDLDRSYFRSVITTRMLLQKLTSAPLNMEADEAIKRLTGNILGPEGQACCIVILNDFPGDQLRQAIGFRKPRWIDSEADQGALFRALQVCDIPLDAAHLGGPPIDNLSINEEGQRTLVRLALAAGGLGLILAWWSLRSITLTLIVILCGIVSTCGATAAIWVTGCHADAIVLAMPSLIYVLTISGAIHLVNYYREAVRTHGIKGAAGRALAAGYKPATLCSVTTALGLLSLFASDLTPIRRFGIFSALGMLLMLAVLFLLLPSALEFFGRKHAFGFTVLGRAPAKGDDNGFIERWAVRWAHWVIHHYRSVCVSGLVLMIGLSFGIAKIHTSVDLLKLFDSNSRILADYHWLEENLGNLVPLEVLVRFDAEMLGKPGEKSSDGKLTILNRIQIVDHVRSQIYHTFGDDGQGLISPPMSAAAFVPPLNSGKRGTYAVLHNRTLNHKLEQSIGALATSGYLAIDPATGDELWRISLRVAAFKNVDYGQFTQEVQEVVNPLVAQASAKLLARESLANAKPIQAIHTGAIPIVYKAQRELLTSLIESTVWSFVTITPLLIWVTRGVGAGIVAMLPNLLPVLAVFGSMGWLGISVDIGCMMTASIALGVAVDDTIHFLCWYRHGQLTCPTRGEAIESAFRSCCRPTLQAAVVNGLGLSVFLLSTFVPTKQFGLLMLVILSCGAIAELILLPAILASPLGVAFDITKSRQPIARSRWVVRLPNFRITVTRRKKEII